MIKVVLVDDEAFALEILQVYLKPLSGKVTVCAACSDVTSAEEAIRLHQPDILLLDIELGEALSFDILEHFPSLDARIIFVTAHEDYMLKAIKAHAFDYLFKPVNALELITVMEKAIDDIASKKPKLDNMALLEHIRNAPIRRIAVPTRRGQSYHSLDDIIYIEADDSYAVLHFASVKPLTVSRKIKDFENSLSDKGFLRIHKSYLVNIDHVVELHREDNGYLVMSDQTRLPIGSKNKEQVIARIKQLCTII